MLLPLGQQVLSLTISTIMAWLTCPQAGKFSVSVQEKTKNFKTSPFQTTLGEIFCPTVIEATLVIFTLSNSGVEPHLQQPAYGLKKGQRKTTGWKNSIL